MFSIGSMVEKYHDVWFSPEKSSFITGGLHQPEGGCVTS